MRTTAFFRPVYGAMFIYFLTTTLSATPLSIEKSFPPKWEKLGQRIVDFKLDRDEIYVTVNEGRFTSIRLFVKKAPVNFHKVIVHYANGDTESIKVRNKILPNQATRIIDLQGNKRVIKKVVFGYDTRNTAGSKAVVELWGRH